jgi:hypothetical protein
MSEIVIHDGVLNRNHDVSQNVCVYTARQNTSLGELETCCVGEVRIHFFLGAFIEANEFFREVS